MKKMLVSMLIALVAVGGLFANGSQEDGSEIPTIKWVQVGAGMPANYDAWQENINSYLEEKIGVHLDVEVVSWGDWDARRSVIINTSEDYDIIFGNEKFFVNDVDLGAFLDITDLVKEETPDLYNLIPEKFWKAASIDGRIFAVPTYKDSSLTNFLVWDEEIAKKYNVDYKTETDFAELTDDLLRIKEGEGVPPYKLASDAPHPTNYDFCGTGLRAIGVEIHDDTRTAVAIYEQEDILEHLEVLHDWYNKGLINADAATLAQAPEHRYLKIAQGWPSAAKTVWGPRMGVEAYAVQYGETVLSNTTVRGSLSCINVNSDHPVEALKLLELANTDSYFRDSLYYGLEGEDFEYKEDGLIHRIKPTWDMAGYAQATFFNVTPTDTDPVGQWDEVKEQNEKATASVMLGFSMDTEPVEDEIANCNTIFQKYQLMLLTGTGEPRSTAAAMMEEMRAAGYDKIEAELQRQIDETFKN